MVDTTDPHGELPFEILCEDGPVLVVNKPAGLLTLGAGPGVPTLERLVKEYWKVRFNKPGNVYLGIPHRLDRPVSGVIVLAKNSKAAARLAEQFRERQVQKTYWCVTESVPDQPSGELIDTLKKVPDKAIVECVPTETPGGSIARLEYKTLATGPFGALLEIQLHTGRMHQIRVQLSSRGWPIAGDHQYGASSLLPPMSETDPRSTPIALHAGRLTFLHPIRYDPVTIIAPLPPHWNEFGLPFDPVTVPPSEPSDE